MESSTVASGSLAGEVGHTIVQPDGPLCNCGSRGCLEALTSGTAIGREGTDAVRKEQRGLLWTAYQENGQVTAADVTAAAEQATLWQRGVAASS